VALERGQTKAATPWLCNLFQSLLPEAEPGKRFCYSLPAGRGDDTKSLSQRLTGKGVKMGGNSFGVEGAEARRINMLLTQPQ